MAKKRAQIPSVDVLFGYNVGQTHTKSTLPTLDEYIFHLSPKSKPQEEQDDTFQVVSTANVRATTSSNPKRPRTLKAGYDFKTETMTVVFRDGTWWNYYDVPHHMWEGFVLAESKGRYLASSGLDQWPRMGEADPGSMSRDRRLQLNDTKEFANYMYGDGSGFAID